MILDDQLRSWAKGMYTTEAAAELLIRAFDGRFADPGYPWIQPTGHGYWVDFAGIGETGSVHCPVANNVCCGSQHQSDPAR